MADIAMHGVTKRYPNGHVAVHDIDLDVADGELLVLVGPSGCGKSTLLRMVAGLEEVTEGQITIGGRDVTDAAPKDRDIAMVFQSYALYPHMTVRRNIGYPLKLAKVGQGRDRQAGGGGGAPAPAGTGARPPARPALGRTAPARRHGAGHRPPPPAPSSWTSPSRTSTPSCACRCAPRSPGCNGIWR